MQAVGWRGLRQEDFTQHRCREPQSSGLARLRRGDVLVVPRLDSLGRSPPELAGRVQRDQQPIDSRSGRPGRDAAHRHAGSILSPSSSELDAERAGHDGLAVPEHLIELAHPIEHEVSRRGCPGGGMGEHHWAGVGWNGSVISLAVRLNTGSCVLTQCSDCVNAQSPKHFRRRASIGLD